MSTVLLTVDNHIATVTLNRPEALNALNMELRRDLAAAFHRVKEDDEIRLAIVTGAGRAFCAGLDMKEAAQQTQQGESRSPEEGATVRGGYLPLDVHKPLIAAVNGAAAGGGLGIALACDILIAAEEALFTSPFAVRGTMSAPILSLLMRKAPPGWATWMSMSGVRVDAQAALRVGLVNEVLPKEELLGRAYEMGERIAGNSYAAVLAIKEKMRQVLEVTMHEAVTVDGPLAQALAARGEAREGFAAFTEKRRAQFG